MEEELLDTVQAAAFLGVSRETVSHFVRNGKLPSRTYGRARLIREADLIAFKAIDRKPGRPPKPKEEGESATGAAETTAEAITTPATVAEPITKTVKAKRTRKVKAAQKVVKPKRKVKAKG